MKTNIEFIIVVVLTLLEMSFSVPMDDDRTKKIKVPHRQKRFYPPLVYSYNAASGVSI